jgi:hypothetical protein
VLVAGAAAPGTAGATFSNFRNGPIHLNNSGQIAFTATLAPGSNAAQTSGVFTSLNGTTTAVAVRGDSAPGTTSARFDTLDPSTSVWMPIVQNNTGRVVFAAPLFGGGSTQTRGLFTSEGGVTTAVAIRGATAPGTNNARFDSFSFTPYQVNDAGKIAFVANLTAASSNPQTQGLFTHTAGVNTAVALRGGAAPGTAAGVTFNTFWEPTINGAGDVAWLSELTGTGVTNANNWAVFATVGGNSQLVVREGDQIDVDPTAGVDLRTVSAIRFGEGSFATQPGSYFNDSGTLVLTLEFTNNTSGVYTFTPVPEPTTILAVGAAGLAVGWLRRRWRTR